MKCFFANGTPITITERESGEGALITWEGGSQLVGPNAIIFGGCHNSKTYVDTNITMNGGTVKHIFGGGLHESYVGTANVVLNGGSVQYVMGGGQHS